MNERLNPIQHLRRAADIGKVVVASWMARQDEKLANAMNPPEVDYPRIYVDHVEAPAEREEDL